MKEVILDEVCDLINGGSWTQSEYVDKGVTVIKSSNLLTDGIDENNLSYLPEEALEKYHKNILEAHDLVVTTVGSHPQLKESAAGRGFIISKDYAGSLLNQNIVCIRTKNENELNKRYLAYLGKSHSFQHFIQQNGRGAANQMRIPISGIKRYKFSLPPLPTQQKIASILSAYDDLIENNLKRIKLLEEAAQNIYKEWFVHMRFPGHKNTPINEETGLPEGWEKDKSSNIFDINIGKTPSRNESEWFDLKEGVKWVSISDMNKSTVFIRNTKEKIVESGIEKFNVKTVPAGTVLLSFKLTIGSVAITTERMCSNEAIAHFNINPLSKLSKEYVFLYLKLFPYSTLGSTSSIGKALNSKIVKAMPFVIPSNNILDEFNMVSRPMFNELENLVNQLDLLKEARDILLPRLMNRTIEV